MHGNQVIWSCAFSLTASNSSSTHIEMQQIHLIPRSFFKLDQPLIDAGWLLHNLDLDTDTIHLRRQWVQGTAFERIGNLKIPTHKITQSPLWKVTEWQRNDMNTLKVMNPCRSIGHLRWRNTLLPPSFGHLINFHQFSIIPSPLLKWQLLYHFIPLLRWKKTSHAGLLSNALEALQFHVHSLLVQLA